MHPHPFTAEIEAALLHGMEPEPTAAYYFFNCRIFKLVLMHHETFLLAKGFTTMNYITIPGIPPPANTMQDVMNVVCNITAVPSILVKSKSRKREITEARQLFCYFSRVILKQTLASTGKYINRDHTSVIHNVQVVKDLSSNNDIFRNKFNQIREKLKAPQL